VHQGLVVISIFSRPKLSGVVSNSNVALRSLVAALLICCGRSSSAQIAGEFYLDKSAFVPGEPVFLYFKVANNGTNAENIQAADPYSFCSGYQVTVSSDRPPESSCSPVGVGGSCFSSSKLIPPGKSQVERLLLNFDNNLGIPGEYVVEATRQLPHASVDVDFFRASQDTLEVHSTLYFRVEQNRTPLAPHVFSPWINQLRSPDSMERREAARTLASLAPKFLEDTLLAFADHPEFRQFAPLAFHRLNTPKSMAAMAELLTKTEPGTFEHMTSADYLAKSADQQWFPLLLDIAQKKPQIGNYVDDAAELGGDQMLPALIELARSADREFTAINAVTAMGSTGSRAAVPILLGFLRDANPDIAERARFALRQLTHRTADADTEGSPQSEYPRWARWWAREGTTAPIYRVGDCGDLVPLP
jgi:hypothetical protein